MLGFGQHSLVQTLEDLETFPQLHPCEINLNKVEKELTASLHQRDADQSEDPARDVKIGELKARRDDLLQSVVDIYYRDTSSSKVKKTGCFV